MSASIKKQSKAKHQMDLKIGDGIPDRSRNLAPPPVCSVTLAKKINLVHFSSLLVEWWQYA